MRCRFHFQFTAMRVFYFISFNNSYIVTFRTILLFLVLFLFQTNAYGGIFGSLKDVVKDGIRKAEKGYQTATKPARDLSHYVYKKTIRKPFNEAKDEFRKAVPDQIEFIYKDNIERRFRPFTDFTWDSTTGRQRITKSREEMIDDYIEQAKELLITPELYAIYQSLKAVSSPLPNDMLAEIEKNWTKVTTNRKLQKNAKFVTSNECVDLLTFGSAEAITLYDVIIFRRPLNNSPSSIALLAHELVHVDQFHTYSFTGFAIKYYIGGKLKTGKDNKLEREAYQVEKKIKKLIATGTQKKSYRTKQKVHIQKWQDKHVIQRIALLDSVNPEKGENLLFVFSDAAQKCDKASILNLAHFAVVNPENSFSKNTKTTICRMIASGRTGCDFTCDELLKWAKISVQYGRGETIDWYFLTIRANECGDIETEYDSLIALASMMIKQEVEKGNRKQLTPRLRGAIQHLERAAYLGEVISWRQGIVFDNRLPFILLASIGFELRSKFRNDNTILAYAERGRKLDIRFRKLDRYHFELLDIYSRVYLSMGMHMKNRGYMLQCINICNMAAAEFNQAGKNVPGIDPGYYNQMRARSRYAQDKLRGR